MKTTLKNILSIIIALSVSKNVALENVKEFIGKFKDEKERKNFFVKVVMIVLLFAVTQLIRMVFYHFTKIELFALVAGLYPYIVLIPLLIFKIKPAGSLNRVDNEQAYEIISLLWAYPIAIIFTIISISLQGILPAILITCLVFAVKSIINSNIKTEIIAKNERFIHTGF